MGILYVFLVYEIEVFIVAAAAVAMNGVIESERNHRL